MEAPRPPPEGEGRRPAAGAALLRFPSGVRWGAAALLFALLIPLLIPLLALAQTFPALTARVVDQANLLGADQRAAIEAKLKAHEDRTTDQIVVAVVRSLEGYEIEDYANRLFRAWKLGQSRRNNGALLLVAPNERKVRIEVGYGLEGALTDALSKIIIATAVAPRFRQGDFAGGINAGLDGMLSILAGDAEEWQRRAEVREDQRTPVDPVVVFIIMVVLFIIIARALRGATGGPQRSHRRRRGGWIVVPGGGWSGGWGGGWSGGGGGGSWGGGGGGGFSGGGGSSGGGGASGSW